jgi:uncharacterized phage protein (TIGR01671 family)
MNRRIIKFRVWGDFGNSSGEFTYIYHCGHHNPSLNDILTQKEFIFQQFTGLKDKNDNEIYEGDIVRTDEAGWIAEVIYDRDCFMCSDKQGGFSTFCQWEKFEVIGNIFENKELLKNE